MSNAVYWTVPEVAQLLKVSPRTVTRWINEGQLVATPIGIRLVRVSTAHLEQFLNTRVEVAPVP